MDTSNPLDRASDFVKKLLVELDGDGITVEDYITAWRMVHHQEWDSIRGGQ